MILRLLLFLAAAGGQITRAQVSQGPLQRQNDVQLLLLLKNSITNWNEYAAANKIQGWTVDTPVCTWTGVACTDTGDVTSLSLQCGACSVKARGTLPPDLSGVGRLTTLNLEGQLFTGGLPLQWFSADAWPQLQNLFLSENPLGGTLPDTQPGAMRMLKQIRLNNCQIEGPLPASTWGRDETSMRRLNVFRAARNKLNGTLPTDWGTAAAFPELTTVDLSENDLSGELPKLWENPKAAVYLQELYLHGNNLTGGLPPGFGNSGSLGSLRYLDLAENPLSGEIPSEWAQSNAFPALRSLDLNGTDLQSRIPSSFPLAFPQLDVMRLAYNNLSGPLPDSFLKASNLQRVVIKPGNPFLCGPIPPNLPFQLCDDRDLTCLEIPVTFLPECPPGLPALQGPYVEPASEAAVISGQQPPPTAASAAAASTPGDESSNTTNSSSEGGGSNTGAIVGGVVGGVVGLLALLAALAAILVKFRRRPAGYATDTAVKPSLSPFMTPEEEEQSIAMENGVMESPFGGQDWQGWAFTSNSAAAGTAAGAAGAATGVRRLGSQSSSSLLPASTKSSHKLLGSLLSGMRGSGSRSQAEQRPSPNTAADLLPLATNSNEISPRTIPGQPPWNDWEVSLNELEVCHRPDGSEWIIGSGGFGKVYKALRNGVQPVAVKVIPSPRDHRPGVQDQTKREIAILRACRDANIVQFQGAYLGEDQTLLVTEYMEGGDLMANIAAGRVTWWRRGRKIAIDVAKGLCFLHARRIVHFDLKSPNILLARDGTAKIADVGMAKFMAQDYITGVVATLAWSAPEMLWGAKCTEKADIYSYGIVLYEIVTGEVPERGRLRDIRVPEECPEEVRQLVLECLETRPSLRPTALQIVERLQATPKTPPAGPAPASPEVPIVGSAGTIQERSERASSEEVSDAKDPSSGSGTAPESFLHHRLP